MSRGGKTTTKTTKVKTTQRICNYTLRSDKASSRQEKGNKNIKRSWSREQFAIATEGRTAKDRAEKVKRILKNPPRDTLFVGT